MIIFATFQTLIISRILGFFLANFYIKQILDACRVSINRHKAMIQNASFSFCFVFFWHCINQPQNQPFLTILSCFRFCKWPFSPFFKILSFLGYWVFSAATFCVEKFRIILEFLSTRKTQESHEAIANTKVITPTNHSMSKQHNEPIRIPHNTCNLLKVQENHTYKVRLILLLIG